MSYNQKQILKIKKKKRTLHTELFSSLPFHLNYSEESLDIHSFHFLNLLLSGVCLSHPSEIALIEAKNYFLMPFPQEHVSGLGKEGALREMIAWSRASASRREGAREQEVRPFHPSGKHNPGPTLNPDTHLVRESGRRVRSQLI